MSFGQEFFFVGPPVPGIYKAAAGVGQTFTSTVKTSTQAVSPATLTRVENLRQGLRKSVAEDVQGICVGEPLSLPPNMCASEHVRLNGTPFRQGVRNTFNVAMGMSGPRGVRDLVEPIVTMIVAESTLSADEARKHIMEDVAAVGATLGQQIKRATQAAAAQIPGLPAAAPVVAQPGQPLLSMPRFPLPGARQPLVPMPGLLPLPGQVTQPGGAQFDPGQSMGPGFGPDPGFMESGTPGPGMPAPPSATVVKTVDEVSYCAVNPPLAPLVTQAISVVGVGPEQQIEFKGEKLTVLPLSLEPAAPGQPTASTWIAQKTQAGEAVVLFGEALFATRDLNLVGKLVGPPCDDEAFVVIEPVAGWSKGPSKAMLLGAGAAVLLLGGGLYLASRKK